MGVQPELSSLAGSRACWLLRVLEDGIRLWPGHSCRTPVGTELELAGRHTLSACNPQKLQQLCVSDIALEQLIHLLFVLKGQKETKKDLVWFCSALFFQLVQVQANVAAKVQFNSIFNQLYISFICDQGAFKYVWGVCFC